VIENFSDVISSEALTLHLFIVIHLTLTDVTVVKLVPLGRLICPTANQTISLIQILIMNIQLKLHTVNTYVKICYEKIKMVQ